MANILKLQPWMQSSQPQQQAQTGYDISALKQAYKPAATAQPAMDTEPSWMDKLTSYSKDPNAAKTEYQRALQVYNAKSAIGGDPAGAAGAQKWMGQVNTAAGGLAAPNPNDELKQYMKQYLDNSSKPKTPFQYDAQSDPAYQAALHTAQTNSQQAAGNIAADMNKRGLLNSTITADRGNQAAQAEYSRVSDTILPQLRNQAYGEYKDAQQQDRYKNDDLMKYIATRYGMNQDEAANQSAAATAAEKTKQNNYDAYIKSVGLTGNLGTGPKSDYSLLGGTDGPMSLDAQKQREQNDIQKAGVTGVYEGNPTIQAKQIAANIDNQTGQLGISQQQANTGVYNAQTSRYTAEQNAANQAFNQTIAQEKQRIDGLDSGVKRDGEISKLLDSSPFVSKTYSEDGKITGTTVSDKQGLADSIISMGLPSPEMQKWFNHYGIDYRSLGN